MFNYNNDFEYRYQVILATRENVLNEINCSKCYTTIVCKYNEIFNRIIITSHTSKEQKIELKSSNLIYKSKRIDITEKINKNQFKKIFEKCLEKAKLYKINEEIKELEKEFDE